MIISGRRHDVILLMVLTFIVIIQLCFVFSSLNQTSGKADFAKIRRPSYYTAKSQGDDSTPQNTLWAYSSKLDDSQIFKKALITQGTERRVLIKATKSPNEYMFALKEKYKNEQYRLSCKYTKTLSGLSRVCFDRYKNGSRGRLTAKAVLTRRESFTEAPGQADEARVRRDHVDKQESVANEDDEKLPEQKKPSQIYSTRHRQESVRKRPVVHKPQHSQALRPVIMNNTWVASQDTHNYRYLVNPSVNICTNGRRENRVDLLVLVTSHPDHSERRDVIRETWGARGSSEPHQLMPVVRVLFLLGVTSLARGGGLGVRLQREVDQHNDIAVEEFLDTYLNLTVKTVMGLKWATRHCPTAHFVMKTDDDMVINMPRLLAFLHKEPQHAYIAGRLAKSYPVLRDPAEKFYVPKDVYAPSTYPDYCIGLGYIMSSDLVNRLYLQSLLTKLFPWEDVFVGILLKQIGIIPRDIRNFYYFKGGDIFEGDVIVDPSKVFFHLRSYYVLDGLTPKQTRILWKQWHQQ